MIWLEIDTWIVIIGALCAAACALPGCFLVLRKMSMMGDAISHAVLPGLALGFLLTGSRTSITMLIGAALTGVLTAVFTQWVSQFGRVDRGAAMGIVFTTLFALGLLLIVQAADTVDLDPGCVLYGAIELAPLDTLFSFSRGELLVEVPRSALIIGAVLLGNVFIIGLLFKELNICSFDPELADTVGINSTLIHYLLMAMVAVTTVVSFEAVGSIIVIAMLIVPAATAYLLTDRLGIMLVLSAILGMAAAGLGHVGALTVPPLFGFESTNTSGMMAAAAGLLFALAWLFRYALGIAGTAVYRRSKTVSQKPEPPESLAKIIR